MEINVSKQPLTVLRSLRNHHPGLSRLLLFECEASEIRRNFSSDRQEPPIFTFELKIQQNVLKYQPNIHTLTPPKKNTRANLINIQITKKKSKVKNHTTDCIIILVQLMKIICHSTLREKKCRINVKWLMLKKDKQRYPMSRLFSRFETGNSKICIVSLRLILIWIKVVRKNFHLLFKSVDMNWKVSVRKLIWSRCDRRLPERFSFVFVAQGSDQERQDVGALLDNLVHRLASTVASFGINPDHQRIV